MLQFFLSSSSAWSQFAKQSVVFPKVALTNNCMIISQKKHRTLILLNFRLPINETLRMFR